MEQSSQCTECKHNKITYCGSGIKVYPEAVNCKQFRIRKQKDSATVSKARVRYVRTEEVYAKIYLP